MRTDFLFARTARIFAARQSLATKTTKIRAVLAFKTIFVTSSARFWGSKVLLRLPRRDFGLQKRFHALLGVFLAFKSSFVVSPKRFQASKELLLPPRNDFGLQKNFCCLPEAISPFKSSFVASTKRFRRSKVLSLPRRSAMRGLHRSASRCLPSFCLLAPLAFCRKALPCLPSFPAENSCLLRQKAQKLVGI